MVRGAGLGGKGLLGGQRNADGVALRNRGGLRGGARGLCTLGIDGLEGGEAGCQKDQRQKRIQNTRHGSKCRARGGLDLRLLLITDSCLPCFSAFFLQTQPQSCKADAIKAP